MDSPFARASRSRSDLTPTLRQTSPNLSPRQQFEPTYLVVGGLLQAGSRGKPIAGEVVEGQTLEWLKVERQYVGRYYMEEREEGIRATGEEVKRRSVDEANGQRRGKRREWLGRTGARQHGLRKSQTSTSAKVLTVIAPSFPIGRCPPTKFNLATIHIPSDLAQLTGTAATTIGHTHETFLLHHGPLYLSSDHTIPFTQKALDLAFDYFTLGLSI